MTPLVSVIIPVYNSVQYLEETICSVTNQTYANIECILVDDGSTDGSYELALNFSSETIKILRNKGKGACSARNMGFDVSAGEFIQFLDADDILSPNKIQNQIEALLAAGDYSNKLIHCQWGRFYKNDHKDVEFWGPHSLIKQNLSPISWLTANHMSMTGCWLTPRSLVDKGGFWNEKLLKNQDGEYFSRLIAVSDEVLYCDEAKVHYRSNVATSISKSNSRLAASSVLESIELIAEYIFLLEKSTRSNEAVANKYLEFAFANFISNPDLAAIAESRAKIAGGSNLKLQGGLILRTVSFIFGWKNALQIKEKLMHLR